MKKKSLKYIFDPVMDRDTMSYVSIDHIILAPATTSKERDRGGLKRGHVSQNVNKLYIGVQFIHLI